MAAPAQTAPAPTDSVLATRRGKQTLALLCAVGFLDFVDASIVNVALPSIRADLGFTIQNLQWVLGGYLLTYGGLMLLGGRAADLVGRRRLLLAGTVVFLISSAGGGLAQDDAALIAFRLVQGVGAAMMLPAALSLLTTTFTSPKDRAKALGMWGALAGLASAVGVFLGGLISAGPGWRWVFFVNLPVCLAVLGATLRLIPRDRDRDRGGLANFDVLGALLVTAGMLLLVYTIVEAPGHGWDATRTVAGLAGSGLLILAFAGYELRHRNPVVPFSIFRIRGLAAADVTQVLAMAGFYAMFFFVTLYMQNVLGFSEIEAGAAYLPTTFGVAMAAGVGAQLITRLGTRPVIVTGALLGAAGMFWLSRIPADGSFLADLLGPLLVLAAGLGLVFVGVTTAAQTGVPEEAAGLAAALINASTWLGGALGVAILSAVATSRTRDVVATGTPEATALTEGFQNALLVAAMFLLAAAVIALRATNSRPPAPPAPTTIPPMVPAPEATVEG
ncbi:DHA2 family efflux MFS transporter permease subunit [Frankia sp. CNm7]|uniref:DHA2 family efflux MFS transporter permease subunit n=1 Tax=Frankia nepalensis TaxID=1836974 RepID=A0A937RA13_9ACTN|nr:DHA2 family efflux MFS transporter permease subunit [Frankia nepalensis]MBL7496796.1 DHA2 family efflux MFS transporter permease subunit [Frankia nepalensis]MBL7511551.1 DHA2 family efflux MFS transporter permease subunit [Frankia nepalensis]MBL7521356.1 DHA2 family efflux MFS transporter permease subunit [Frankia nepalensis]MBL7626645.1 DHA2 family efflux MFS transporter permease subunit [Frankia nepalensis]